MKMCPNATFRKFSLFKFKVLAMIICSCAISVIGAVTSKKHRSEPPKIKTHGIHDALFQNIGQFRVGTDEGYYLYQGAIRHYDDMFYGVEIDHGKPELNQICNQVHWHEGREEYGKKHDHCYEIGLRRRFVINGFPQSWYKIVTSPNKFSRTSDGDYYYFGSRNGYNFLIWNGKEVLKYSGDPIKHGDTTLPGLPEGLHLPRKYRCATGKDHEECSDEKWNILDREQGVNCSTSDTEYMKLLLKYDLAAYPVDVYEHNRNCSGFAKKRKLTALIINKNGGEYLTLNGKIITKKYFKLKSPIFSLKEDKIGFWAVDFKKIIYWVVQKVEED
jgi:hypothetical protein